MTKTGYTKRITGDVMASVLLPGCVSFCKSQLRFIVNNIIGIVPSSMSSLMK